LSFFYLFCAKFSTVAVLHLARECSSCEISRFCHSLLVHSVEHIRWCSFAQTQRYFPISSAKDPCSDQQLFSSFVKLGPDFRKFLWRICDRNHKFVITKLWRTYDGIMTSLWS